MTTIAQRVREVRTAHHLTHAEFAEKLDEAYHRINDIERGKQRTPAEFVSKIVNVFKINAHWILTGEGDMFPPKHPLVNIFGEKETDCVESRFLELDESEGEQSLDDICRLLTSRQRQELCARLNDMLRLNRLEMLLNKPPASDPAE